MDDDVVAEIVRLFILKKSIPTLFEDNTLPDSMLTEIMAICKLDLMKFIT